MFLKKNTNKMRSLFSVFALLALAVTVLWFGANNSTTYAGGEAGEKTSELTVSQAAPSGATRGTLFDFTGEGRTDFTTLVFNENANITWNVVGNPKDPDPNEGLIRRFDYGFAGDLTTGAGADSIVPRDYVGDLKTEVAVYRDSDSVYYLAQFPLATNTGITLDRTIPFGNGATDNFGAEGDYDGDGKIDYTAVRVQGGILNWYILTSGTNTFRVIQFGTFYSNTATPFRRTAIFQGADFTGDGRDELVVVNYTAASGTVNYLVGDAVTGAGVITKSFGNFNSDFSVTPADYTGDGIADFVAVRQTQGSNQIWYVNNSATNETTATAFGYSDPLFEGSGDSPVRGDYDGDGRHDIAVYRPTNRTFYYISTANSGSLQGQEAGNDGETPLGSFGLY